MKTFESWIDEINRLLDLIGLSIDDLPDCPYRDWFEDGMTAKRASAKAIKMASE
jgi:hypothetical protein